MTLFTTGVKRPYYVREIARNVDERLNAVRRELEILRKIGMLDTHMSKRRKFYTINPNFALLSELSGIMQKAGPGVEDTLFKNIERLGKVQYACVSGYFTGAAKSPTDLLLVGTISDDRMTAFVQRIEDQLEREITYTPMPLSEYKYRLNFNDLFLRSIFQLPYKALFDKLPSDLKPEVLGERNKIAV